MDELLGYSCVLAVGFVIGLFGGGGGILSIPVLLYLFGIQDEDLVTAYAVLMVGVAASVGAYRNGIKGQLSLRAALWLGVPAFMFMYATRKWLLPAIPEVFALPGAIELPGRTFKLGLIIGVMLIAAVRMLWPNKQQHKTENPLSGLHLVAYAVWIGALVGIVSGITGAGGGFIIVPALVFMMGLPIKVAIGTTQLILATKAVGGLIGDLGAGRAIDWGFGLWLCLLAIGGVWLGIYASGKLKAARLRVFFAIFLIIMAVFMILKEFLA